MMLLLFLFTDYRINFWYMSKDGAIKITSNFDLNEKSGLL